MKKLLVFAAIASLLAGCGGGGSSSAVPKTGGSSSTNNSSGSQNSLVPISSPQGTARATATASVSTSALLPSFAARAKTAAVKRRSLGSFRTPLSSGIAQVIVKGTLFQGTASATVVTNSQTLTPTNNGVTVSMTFSNVVPANNDWIIFDFTAQAADGSQYDLGVLATMIDITSNGTNTVNLDVNSTLRFQAILTSLGQGISSYDLENNAGLDAAIGSYLTSHPQYVPDPNTGFFSQSTAQLIANDLLTMYGRTVTLSTLNGAVNTALYSITYDYTSPDENNLIANACPFDESSCSSNGGLAQYTSTGNLAAGITSPYFIYGSPGGAGTACNDVSSANPSNTVYVNCQSPVYPAHAPGSGLSTAYASIVSAAMINGGGNSSITVPVYGGHIIVGAHERSTINSLVTLPTFGGTTAISGEAPGAFSVPISLNSTALTVSAVDPQTQALDPAGSGWSTGGLFGGSDGYGGFSLCCGTLEGSVALLYDGASVPTGAYTAYPGNTSTFPETFPELYYLATNISPSPVTGSLTIYIPEVFAGYTYSLAAELSGSGTWTTIAGPVNGNGTQFNNGSITFPSVPVPASTTEAFALFVTVNNSSTPFTPVFSYILQPNYVTSGGAASFYTYCPGPTNGAGACDFAEYATPPTTTTYNFSPPNSVPGAVPVFGGPTIQLTLDTWNPFGLTNAQLDMCSVSGCTPLNTGGTINATSTFYDNGTNLSYYNWAGPGSDVTSSVVYNGPGYKVNYSGPGTGSFSSTTPALFAPQSTVYLDSNSPSGTAWGMTITDNSGNTYTAVRTSNHGASSQPVFFFPSIVTPVTSQKITFTYTLPGSVISSGNFIVYYL